MNKNISEVINELGKWYFKEWFLIVYSVFLLPIGLFTVVGFLGYLVPIVLISRKIKLQQQVNEHANRVSRLDNLKRQIDNQEQLLKSIRKNLTQQVELELSNRIQESERLEKDIESLKSKKYQQEERIIADEKKGHEELEKLNKQIIIKKQQMEERIAADEKNYWEKSEKLNKQIVTQKRKLVKLKNMYRALEYALSQESILTEDENLELEELCPTVTIHIHSMDLKELRKEFKDNEKAIQSVLEKYQSNYTTKANRTIYSLMVLALSAELQNVLYNLKYTNLDKSQSSIYALIKKYRVLVIEGNQHIASTMNRCILELEYFYLNAVQIEYSYYIAKEQQKNEQAALREQMKQEAEERKQLEIERKLIEKEESKYLLEIQKAQEQLKLQENQDEASQQLLEKISQLESQLKDVQLQKEEVIKRQNGKAGYVYIISNLGSFGEDVFKVGMTRRLDPMDRVKELGSASVPFQFDVHSFIFSNDAVGLEQELHQALEEYRVNKVNHRKEFFQVSLDTLEELVLDIDPTAEFNRTMIAEEYRQGLALL